MQQAANSATQLTSEFCVSGYRTKSKRALGNAIADGQQAEIYLGALIQDAIVGTDTNSFMIQEPTVHVANAVVDPETGATLLSKQLL